MAHFIRSDKDPLGKLVRIERGFSTVDGRHYFLLRRLPPEYAKPPLFLVELSSQVLEMRDGSSGVRYHKAFAHQELTPKETKFLCGCKAGKPVVPFLNFSYPNVLRILGKHFNCMTEDEIGALAARYTWKLVGGHR